MFKIQVCEFFYFSILFCNLKARVLDDDSNNDRNKFDLLLGNNQIKNNLSGSETKITLDQILTKAFENRKDDRDVLEIPASIQSGYIHEDGVTDHHHYKKDLETQVIYKYFKGLNLAVHAATHGHNEESQSPQTMKQIRLLKREPSEYGQGKFSFKTECKNCSIVTRVLGFLSFSIGSFLLVIFILLVYYRHQVSVMVDV